MIFNIDKRLFLYLSSGFFICTIIGTLSHECGHYIAARLMGYQAHISYNSTWLTDENPYMNNREITWFILAGPLQTMLTGTVGFIFLLCTKKNKELVSTKQWVFIFLSLFWLRQTANYFLWISNYLLLGKWSNMADEINLANMLHLPAYSFISVSAIIGLLVLTLIISRFIPLNRRLTFILSGLTGGISGFLCWLVYVGKLIMP